MDEESEWDQDHEWSYEGECGPQTWDLHYKNARGNHQSPINIETNLAIFNPKFIINPLKINYNSKACYQIKNTGHTFQIDGYTYINNKTKVSGGPCLYNYKFLQFHMHWGDNIERGSEHLIDSHAYSAELHFVNWNHDLFKDPKTASLSNDNDGLLVLAVFIKVGKFNQEFEKLTKSIHGIHLKDQHVSVDHIDIQNVDDYWTYPGSLTTPPCSESVTWIVFKEPIEMAKEQLNVCHELYSVSNQNLCNEYSMIKYNDRPICSIGDRIVQKSFQ